MTHSPEALAIGGKDAQPRTGSFWKSEFERIYTLSAAAMRRVADRRRRKAEMAALARMTDRELRDVSLCRADVGAIADGVYDLSSR